MIIGAGIIVLGFFISAYMTGNDPKVQACFETAQNIENLANEQRQGYTDEVVLMYADFLIQCDFMLNMDEQRKSNPELHERLDQMIIDIEVQN